MSPLNRKLVRDLWRLGGQLLTIALVVAAGVAAFVTMRSAHQALLDSRASFYAEKRFGDVFAHLQRAPNSLGERIAAIDGVASVETRIVTRGSMPMEGMTEPASMAVLSIPVLQNTIFLREGRMPRPDRREEVVINDAFAEAHRLEPGDTLSIVISGIRHSLTIVGIGLSPEYVITLTIGDMAMDARKNGVVFMQREQLAASLDMVGAFNNVSLLLMADGSQDDVIDELDLLLDRYGGLGASGRDRQPSHFMLDQELSQLENMSSNIPPLFLLVAAFLLHVVLSRLVQLQRPQIATLKALGYSKREIGMHFLALAMAIVVVGAALGLLLSVWMTDAMIGLYTEYFRFPSLRASLDLRTTVVAVLVSSLAAFAGTMTSVRSVLRLAPAEAMRPAAPATYRRGWLSRLPGMGPAARMVFREIERRPLRLILSAVAISVAVGLMVVGQFMSDAMDYLSNTYMHRSQRWDMQVMFAKPRPSASLSSFDEIPGVFYVEGIRNVPADVRHGSRGRSVGIVVHPDGAELLQVVDEDGRRLPIPRRGAMLTRLLGERLDLELGDVLEVDVLEGERRTIRVPVVAFANELMGLQVHVGSDYFHSLVGEEPSVSGALMEIDTDRADELDAEFAALPDVVGISHMKRILAQFREQSANNVWVMSLIMALFAATIAIGVVYNNARVALSMRSRDLASLRVLGFTRAEIAGILIGELSVQVFIAIPIGLALGKLMAIGLATGGTDPEVYRLPAIVSARTYAGATVLTLLSALFSAWLVRRKLYGLDLIGVLKTRE